MYVYVGVGGGVCTWYNSRGRGAHGTTAGVGGGKEKQGHKTGVSAGMVGFASSHGAISAGLSHFRV